MQYHKTLDLGRSYIYFSLMLDLFQIHNAKYIKNVRKVLRYRFMNLIHSLNVHLKWLNHIVLEL